MASTVYSTRFLYGDHTLGLAYVVPAGFRAVVRQLSIFNGNLTSFTEAYFNVLTGGVWWGIADSNPLTPQFHAQEGRWIAEAGETISFGAGQPCDAYAGGYLLSLP